MLKKKKALTMSIQIVSELTSEESSSENEEM